MNTPSLYETDYQLWLEKTLACIRAGDWSQVDVEHLVEELEDLGQSNQHAVASYLMRLCEHLLKLKYWDAERERCYRGWLVEIRNFRIEIQDRLKRSPSLYPFVEDIFSRQYQRGRKLFLDGSGLDEKLVPETPPFTLAQALDENWLP
ncbi:MAG: DUF29 domain-containing protein [Gloeomargarita sp. SKYBB_i_bin120]|nr:DUF29 domain-containing protein [Gloeomargarita sp. SKYB120]MDW8178920.1 DUF29 domain-containing protein [Gloeomargarita sp. SKYBB_i_bin120]